ncbi:MAG: hypothetical protein H6613_12420 [Ignavibacteriales bacterium]|nr:hypothetical protein [Ignavibacteriales bacterium]
MSDTIFASKLRRNILITFITFIGIGFIFQLIKMQIIENAEYTLRSDSNSIKKNPQQAPREFFR